MVRTIVAAMPMLGISPGAGAGEPHGMSPAIAETESRQVRAMVIKIRFI